MQLDQLKSLHTILADLDFVLKNKIHLNYLYRREGEELPENNKFYYKPVVAVKKVEKIIDTNLCTLCGGRISYKKEQFVQQAPKLPFGIILHNDLLLKKGVYFQNAAEDQMFAKIVESMLQMPPQDFLVREAIRCHFAAGEYFQKQWRDNCLSHLRNDIEQFSLRGLLILGKAAQIFFPDKEQLQQALDKVVTFEGIPAVVSPGPSRLVYMQKNNFSTEEITQEKRKIFAAVKRFHDEVMQKA